MKLELIMCVWVHLEHPMIYICRVSDSVLDLAFFMSLNYLKPQQQLGWNLNPRLSHGKVWEFSTVPCSVCLVSIWAAHQFGQPLKSISCVVIKSQARESPKLSIIIGKRGRGIFLVPGRS